MNEKFFGMLGLAMRAGAAAVGEGKATAALRSGKAGVLLLAADASENTRKKFYDLCNYRKIPIVEIEDRWLLGKTVGRTFAVTIAVTNENFSRRLLELAQKDLTDKGAESKGV